MVTTTRHNAPLVVRILLMLPVFFALALPAAHLTHTQNRPSARTQEATRSQAEQPPAAIQELANRVAANISKLTAKRKILVLDFSGPEKLWLPFSAWLADQFSAGLVHAGEPLEIIPRSQLADAMAERHLAAKETLDDKNAESLAQLLGADAIVKGSFVAFGDRLIVDVAYLTTAANSWASAPPTQTVHSKIEVVPEIAAHLDVPFNSLRPKDGIYRAWEAGIGSPVCVRCPRVPYPRAASGRRVEGVITLDTIITANGDVAKVRIIKSVDPALDEAAVDTVRNWKFKPATDPDGKAVPVRQMIEVTFHLY
jgi:TonB family protein